MEREEWNRCDAGADLVGRAEANRFLVEEVSNRTHRRARDLLVVVLYVHLSGEQRRELWWRAADALAADGTLLMLGHGRSNVDEGGPRNSRIRIRFDGKRFPTGRLPVHRRTLRGHQCS